MTTARPVQAPRAHGRPRPERRSTGSDESSPSRALYGIVGYSLDWSGCGLAAGRIVAARDGSKWGWIRTPMTLARPPGRVRSWRERGTEREEDAVGHRAGVGGDDDYPSSSLGRGP